MEILRRFIQRVQAMKSPDHNGEDNFARDFMVSVRLALALTVASCRSPARPESRPAGPSCQRFVCGSRAQLAASAMGELAGGEVAPAPQPPSSAARAALVRPPARPPGSGGSGRGPARPGPGPANTYCLPGG